MSMPDPRPTLAAPDDDPYLWLEEIENPRVLDWIATQNAATLQRFSDEGVAADHRTLKAIFDRPDNIPFPNRRANSNPHFSHDRMFLRSAMLCSEAARLGRTRWFAPNARCG
jgi:prolyl oligopeptidase